MKDGSQPMIAAIFRMSPRLSCFAFRASALAGAMAFAIGMASAETVGVIAVENAWSRAVPDGATVGVGYLTIRNEGDEADRLVSASAALAGETEIHQTTMEGGVMRMRPVPGGVSVPAKSTVMLEPSGYHLMLMGLTRPLKEGDTFPTKLTFEHAGSVEVTFHVLGIGAQGPKTGQQQ
jgi:copper(I)-binding protein